MAAGVHDRRRLVIAAVLLGVGLGGFFDGIVLHQILQWHHMISTLTPPNTLDDLELNTLGDGMFHAATWIVTVAGVIALMSANGARDHDRGTRTLIGGLLGASFGYWIAIWSSDYWPLVVGGKAIASWIPYTVFGFELMVLIGSLATVLGQSGGSAAGPLVAGVLAEWAPAPRQLCYLVAFAATLATAVAVLRVPEPRRSTGRWRPQRPSVPAPIRRPFARRLSWGSPRSKSRPARSSAT